MRSSLKIGLRIGANRRSALDDYPVVEHSVQASACTHGSPKQGLA